MRPDVSNVWDINSWMLFTFILFEARGRREEGGGREMSQIYDLLAAIVSCPATRYLIQFFVPHKAAQSVYIVYVQPIPINIFIKTCQ